MTKSGFQRGYTEIAFQLQLQTCRGAAGKSRKNLYGIHDAVSTMVSTKSGPEGATVARKRV